MGTMKVGVTPVFYKNDEALNNPNIRNIVNIGGSRSSKSTSIVQMLILYAMTNQDKIIDVVRKTSTALKASVMVDFNEHLTKMGIYNTVKINNTLGVYRFPSGSVINFFGVDDANKLRGRKRDIVFINEATEVDYDSYMQLNLRCKEKVIIDFNPSDETHWVFDLKPLENTVWIHSTFRDNPFLEANVVREIENLVNQDETYYEIYNLGIVPRGREKVFQKIEYSKFPNDINFVYGMDFGWVDPVAVSKVGIKDGKLYAKQMVYGSYLKDEEILKLMEKAGIDKSVPIYCDHANPDKIAMLRDAGYNADKANKDRTEGFGFMRQHQLVLDEGNNEMDVEFRNFSFKKRHGKYTDETQEYNDHSIDATRYGAIALKDEGYVPSFIFI